MIHRGAPDHHHLQTRCPYDGLSGARSRVVAPDWRYYFARPQRASLEKVLSAPPRTSPSPVPLPDGPHPLIAPPAPPLFALAAPNRTAAGIETFGLPDGLDLVGEDDDEDPEEEDLLCDYAPGPLQTDGSVGLVADDGTVSLPVTPTLARSGWSYETNRGPTDEQRRATRCGVVGWGGADEPCLSDSWQHLQERDADAREGASITALRAQYHRMFGKETSSNNRQWLVRRLSEIRRYGDGEEEAEEEEEDDSAGGDHSGAGDRSDLDDDGRVSPFTSGGSAGTHVTGDYLDGTLSPRKAKGAHFKGGPALRREARGRGVALLARESPGRRGAASVSHGGSKGSRRGRGDPADSHSGEGGAAKTDGSVAGRKRKGGHHSDSDEGEPPVKSRAVAHAGGRGHGKAGGAGGRKGADGAGANGRRSKHHNPWALEEAEALVDGVAKCGGGKWADIKKLGFPAIEHRTAVDLKDKWRNLLRIAMLPHQPVKSAGDKKREIPAELLARVRELAAKQAKKAALDGRGRSAGR